MVSLRFIPFVIALYKLFCLLFLRSSVLSQTLHITTQLVRSCSFSYLLRTVLNTIIFVSRAMPFLSVLESFRSRRRQFHLGRHLGFIFKQKFQRHKRTRGKVCPNTDVEVRREMPALPGFGRGIAVHRVGKPSRCQASRHTNSRVGRKFAEEAVEVSA